MRLSDESENVVKVICVDDVNNDDVVVDNLLGKANVNGVRVCAISFLYSTCTLLSRKVVEYVV
jgi:hypothetical protein